MRPREAATSRCSVSEPWAAVWPDCFAREPNASGRSSAANPCLQPGSDTQSVNWTPPHLLWTDDIDQVLSSDADVLVELLGGLQPAHDWVRRALQVRQIGSNRQQTTHRPAWTGVVGAGSRRSSSFWDLERAWREAFRCSGTSGWAGGRQTDSGPRNSQWNLQLHPDPDCGGRCFVRGGA